MGPTGCTKKCNVAICIIFLFWKSDFTFSHIFWSQNFKLVSFRHSSNAQSESLILNAISTDLWICGPPGRERHLSHKSNTLPHSWLCSLLLQGASVAGCTWSKYFIVWTIQDPRMMIATNLSLNFHNGRKVRYLFMNSTHFPWPLRVRLKQPSLETNVDIIYEGIVGLGSWILFQDIAAEWQARVTQLRYSKARYWSEYQSEEEQKNLSPESESAPHWSTTAEGWYSSITLIESKCQVTF